MLHAAVDAGADAVYLGMGEFNARRNAQNFGDAEFAAACDYAHVRGVRIYVAMNTLILPHEMDSAISCARRCAKAGADGFIVQDVGLALELKRHLPEARLHASTQMSIQNSDGMQACSALGIERVTLARELSLEEIAHLVQVGSALGMQVEVFAHGALCVCYSGRCLMSSMIGGRSANRGLCAQACRLPYELVDLRDPDRKLNAPGEHLLSPKDLCTIDLLSELSRIGVASLKIEGRMKSPEYVHTVVGAYREILDKCVAGSQGDFCENGERLTKDARNRLGSVFSRGFTTAYLEGERGNAMMSYQRPNNRGQFIGRVTSVAGDTVNIACEKPLVAGDVLEVWTRKTNVVLTVDELGACRISTGPESRKEKGSGGKKRNAPYGFFVHPGDRVFRVRSAEAAYEDNVLKPKIPLRGKAILKIGQPLKVEFRTCDDGAPSGRRIARMFGSEGICACATGCEIEAARTKEVTEDEIYQHIDRLGQTPFRLTDFHVDLDEGVGIGFSQLHHCRSSALQTMQEAILEAYKRRFTSSSATSHAPAKPAEPARMHAAWQTRQDEAVASAKDSMVSTAAGPTIAAVVTNPECARAAKRAGADALYVSALNYKRGQSTTAGCLDGDIQQAGYPKHCVIMIPSVRHDARGHSREAVTGNPDVWDCAKDGGALYMEDIGALMRGSQMSDAIEIGPDLPLTNAGAIEMAAAFGAMRIWLSPELNLAQIRRLIEDAQKRLGGLAPSFGLKILGAQELMVSEHCMLMSQGECAENCPVCKRRRIPYALRDRKGYQFPVVTDCMGRSHLYNSVMLDNIPAIPELLQNGVSSFMLDATLMTPEQTAQAAGRLRQALKAAVSGSPMPDKQNNATTGHLHRGVL